MVTNVIQTIAVQMYVRASYSPQPISTKTHHLLDSEVKTTTNMRKSMIPSHSIQQKAARKK